MCIFMWTEANPSYNLDLKHIWFEPILGLLYLVVPTLCHNQMGADVCCTPTLYVLTCNTPINPCRQCRSWYNYNVFTLNNTPCNMWLLSHHCADTGMENLWICWELVWRLSGNVMWTEEKDRLKIVVFVSMFCIVNLVSEFKTRRPASYIKRLFMGKSVCTSVRLSGIF